MNQRDDSSYELISAYLDGELTPDERARVEQLVASSEAHQQALDEMRAVVGGMQALSRHRLDEAFSQRVVAAARAAGVRFELDARHQAPRPVRARSSTHVWHWPAALGLLATAAAAVLVALLVWHPGEDSLTSNSRPLASPMSPRDGGVSVGSPASTPGAAAARDDRAKTNSTAASPAAALVAKEGPSPATVDVAPPDAAKRGVPDEMASPQVAQTPSGPAPPVVDSSAPPSPVVADAGTGTQPRQVAGQRPAPGDDRLSGRTPSDVPSSASQQMMLVIDVALTPQGADKGAFERTLGAHDVAIAGTAVPVDERLEASLLASRFFEPVKAESEDNAAARAALTLIYVKTRAGHVDEIWRAMQANQSEFASVKLDMAFLTEDQTMFQELRRAVDQQAVNLPPLPAEVSRARRAAGHRLALSPSWRGSPATKLKGLTDLAGSVPQWMLGPNTEQHKPVSGIPGQPAPTAPLPPGGPLGANIDAEVLFVVHMGRVVQE